MAADVVAAGSALQPKKHPFWCDYLYGEKTSWNTKLQAAGVAAAVAQAGHDQLLGSCAAVRRSSGRHSTCQAAGQVSQPPRLPPLCQRDRCQAVNKYAENLVHELRASVTGPQPRSAALTAQHCRLVKKS